MGCERRSEGVPVCSEEKLCEREPQHCSEKTDRESGGGKGWQCDPLFEGGGLIITKYNTPYMHAQAGHMPIIGILVNI